MYGRLSYIFKDHLYIPGHYVTLRIALSMEGHPNPGVITLHTFRRGGAQACTQRGAPITDINDLDHWLSVAIHTYVPKFAVSKAGQKLYFDIPYFA